MTNEIQPGSWGKNASVFAIRLADILQGLDKVIENFGGHHDAIPVRAHFFGNTHHAASGIALEVNEESLAICDDFFCANDIVVHCCMRGVRLYTPRKYTITGNEYESTKKWWEGDFLGCFF